MHDDRNSADNRAKLSADDLLARLKQSYDEVASGDNAKNEAADRPRTEAHPTEALKIDDAVYSNAEQTLRESEALGADDDSELDVDELIDMYITKPREEREAENEAAEAENAAVEDELSDTHEFGAESVGDEVFVQMSFDEVAAEIAEHSADPEPDVPATLDEDALLDEAMFVVPEEAPLTKEEIVEDVAEDIAEEFTEEIAEQTAEGISDDDSDMKLVAEESYDEPLEYADEDVLDTQTTAVFDISMVREMASKTDDEVNRAIDEALAESATEVFDRISDDDLANAEISQTYGKTDDTEVDQTDLHIMLAFGMEEQLKQAVGEEEASKIEEDVIQKHEQTTQISIVEEPIEYTSREQNNEIMAKYESRYKSLLVRIAAAAALLVAVFIIENFSIFGLSLPAFMRPTSYPVVYAMIDLQLVVFSGVLVYRQLIEAYNGILKKKFSPETLTALMLALSLVYSLVAGIIAPTSGFAMYNLPVVFAVLASLVYEFLNLKREMFGFNVVASKKKKLVVSPVSNETDSLEREVFGEYVPDDAQIVRVGKTDFVDGFFERSAKNKPTRPIIGILLPAMLLLAIVFVVVGAIGGGVYGAITSAFLTVAFCAPLTLFAIYSYPFYKASKDAFENESAILGEASLDEYAASSIISFEDKEVFPPRGTKVTSIKVFGQNRIDEIVYNLASAFVKVDGPLADVFAQATQDIGYSEDVELVEVDEDGFTVTVDGDTVYIGKASYMEKKDYEPPFDSEARRQDQGSALGILYVAFGGQLAAKMYVQYTIDGEFEKVLAQLYRTGMCVGIKSFDPNIDDMLLAKKIHAIKYPVKVIRARTVEDIPHTVDRCESGVVSKHSVKALLRTVALCERVSSVIKTNLIIGMLAMIIGVIVMIFVSALGATAMPSVYALLYQIFWIVPVVLISKFLV